MKCPPSDLLLRNCLLGMPALLGFKAGYSIRVEMSNCCRNISETGRSYRVSKPIAEKFRLASRKGFPLFCRIWKQRRTVVVT
jgi:hypothetical protein